MSCIQIEVPNSGLKGLKKGPKPRSFGVGGAKSLDFTTEKWDFVFHVSMWLP